MAPRAAALNTTQNGRVLVMSRASVMFPFPPPECIL